jgi:hypothetical protein
MMENILFSLTILRVGGKYRLAKKAWIWCVFPPCFPDSTFPKFRPCRRHLGINIISGEEVAIELESVMAKHPQLERS